MDENGEPLVVYHGSRWNPLAEESGKAVFRHNKILNTSEGVGFYFTPDKSLAEGWGDADGYFLNIRGPRSAFDKLNLLSDDDFYDIAEREDLSSDEIDEALGKAQTNRAKKKMRDVIDLLRKKGYSFHGEVERDYIGTMEPSTIESLLDYTSDLAGFLDGSFDNEQFQTDLRNAETEVFGIDGYFSGNYANGKGAWIAFTPSQIKSATDNLGTFDGSNPDIRFQIAGRAGAARLGMRGLGDAEAMERSGATREEIWRETGWWRGRDGEWRVEVPDITPTPANFRVFDGGYGAPLSELMQAQELMAAYPDLADIPVFFNSVMSAAGHLTERNGKTVIELNAGKALQFFNYKNGTHVLTEDGARILSHEIQHAIQLREGFARGASPEYWQKQIDGGYDSRPESVKAEENRLFEQYARERDANPGLFTAMEALDASTPTVPRGKFNPNTLEKLEEDPPEWKRFDKARDELVKKYGARAVFGWFRLRDRMRDIARTKGDTAFDLYRQTAGEVEARNVERRLSMTPEERAATPPWETEDVEEGRQIVRHSVQATMIQEEGLSHNDAVGIIAGLRGKIYVNRQTGIEARLSSHGAGKLVSNAAVEKTKHNGFTAKQHNAIAAKIDVLFQDALLAEDRPDKAGDVNVKSIKRFVCPITIGTTEAVAWITVKESTGHGHRIYSVEGIKIAVLSPAVKRVLADNNSADSTAGLTHAFPGAEVKSEGTAARGSVVGAGSDPGWFELAGQLEAAEREAGAMARHGLAFGGGAVLQPVVGGGVRGAGQGAEDRAERRGLRPAHRGAGAGGEDDAVGRAGGGGGAPERGEGRGRDADAAAGAQN